MKIFESLFGLEFLEVTDETKNTWHEDCKQFRVYNEKPKDGSEQTFVGWLYLDLHPREGKYGHAANFNLQPVGSQLQVMFIPTNDPSGIYREEGRTPLSSNISCVQLFQTDCNQAVATET